MFGATLRIIDRNPRVLSFNHADQSVVENQIRRERKNIGTRDHNCAHRNAIEFDGVVDHFFLELRNLTELAAGGHDELQFVWRMNAPVRVSCAPKSRRTNPAERLIRNKTGLARVRKAP